MRGALLAFVMVAGPAAAQQPLPHTGSELFRGVLHRVGFRPVEDLSDRPLAVVLVGHPRGQMQWATQAVQDVQRRGGAVLVAVDNLGTPNPLIPGGPGSGTTHPGRFVLARGLESGVRVNELQAAEPSDQPPVLPLAVVTAGNFVLRLPATHGAWRPLALRDGEVVGACVDRPSRAVMLADAGTFSNRLMAGRLDDGTDTGNLELALNLARWLKPAGDGPTPCLFVENGRVVTDFTDVYEEASRPQLPTTPPPTLSDLLRPEAQAKLTEALDEAVDRVQTDDNFHRALTRGNRYAKTVQWLLGVLALMTAVALVRRARAARRPTETPPLAAPAGPGKPFAQRREELLRAGDHSATVRDYLLELFRHHGLPLDEYRHPKRMPKVEADAATQQRLRTLWRVAYGPPSVTYSRWKELEPMIEAVRADGAAGRWRFAGGRA